MKKVLVFAGTTEGRELAELLADSNIKCSVCVATDYALELMNDKRLDVNCGRLTEEEMEVLMRDGKFDVVVDATHPYAQIVSQNVRQAADKESISLIRLRRSTESAEEGFVSFKTHEECSAWLSFHATLTKLLGTSAWYAPGAAGAYVVESIIHNQKKMIPCSVYLEGEYGESDICIGVPVILGKNGIEKIVELELTADEKAKFAASAAAVHKTNAALKEVGAL